MLIKMEFYRFQAAEIKALQEAAEIFLEHWFEDANICAIYAKRQTVMRKDFAMLKKIRGRLERSYWGL